MRVAPREIVDVVYRAARVGGLDPGSAEEFAEAAAFAEIHLHAGLGLACGVVCETPLDRRAVAAYRAIDVAVSSLTDDESLAVPMPEGVTRATLAKPVHDLAKRGISVDQPAGIASSITLRRGATTSPFDDARTAAAVAGGIDVDPHLWECIGEVASRYLVSETELDAAG